MEWRKLLFIVAVCGLFDPILAFRKFFLGKYFGDGIGLTYKPINKTFPQEWFEQNLDHFDPTNNQTWKQLYYTNPDYYKPGGPVFLLIGGEGPITQNFMHEGAWIGYAKKYNALCFQLEHRYYGVSWPTPTTTTDELQFLSSEQALADLANFIVAMNTKYNLTDTKWISFGGSYPGSLSAWLREKYPHLVHGAISSSGPLLAKSDFKEYFEVVINSLETHSDTCVQAVQAGMNQVEVLLRHMIGQRSITSKFQLCDPIEQRMDNPLDVSNLFENLASLFAGCVQYSGDPKSQFGINEVCTVMVNKTLGYPVDRLAEVNRILLKQEGEKCLDYRYDNMINELQTTKWDAKAIGSRSWTYQTCTEFGFYQTSSNASSVFGNRFPIQFFIQMCQDIFGKGFNERLINYTIYRTNMMYGGLNPSTTNVLYVHGSLDPWHALGLYTSKNPNTPTIYIQGTAHCANMYEPRSQDLPQLVAARETISKYIGELLSK